MGELGEVVSEKQMKFHNVFQLPNAIMVDGVKKFQNIEDIIYKRSLDENEASFEQ